MVQKRRSEGEREVLIKNMFGLQRKKRNFKTTLLLIIGSAHRIVNFKLRLASRSACEKYLFDLKTNRFKSCWLFGLETSNSKPCPLFGD